MVSNEIYGVKIETVKSMPKNEAWFVDPATAAQWKEYDKMYRLKWWLPLAWFSLWRTKLHVRKIAKAIVKNIGNRSK